MTTAPLAPATRSGLVAIALQTLGVHAMDHHLPAPDTISVSRPHQPLAIEVYIGADRATQEWWLATVTVHDVTEEHHPVHSVFVWDVSLPNGHLFKLRGTRNAASRRVGVTS